MTQLACLLGFVCLVALVFYNLLRLLDKILPAWVWEARIFHEPKAPTGKLWLTEDGPSNLYPFPNKRELYERTAKTYQVQKKAAR